MKENTNVAIVADYREYHGGYFKTLVSPEQSGGALAMMEMTLPQGAEPPLHSHDYEDEAFYILEGVMQFVIGEEVIDLCPGEGIFAPRKTPHLFKILSPEARFITVITPGKFWEYFMEFSTPAAGELQVKPPQGPPPPEMIALLTSRMSIVYGITMY
jgi:quercetin dioxygenase-like cupin family protein